jgi:hypothetical protein
MCKPCASKALNFGFGSAAEEEDYYLVPVYRKPHASWWGRLMYKILYSEKEKRLCRGYAATYCREHRLNHDAPPPLMRGKWRMHEKTAWGWGDKALLQQPSWRHHILYGSPLPEEIGTIGWG